MTTIASTLPTAGSAAPTTGDAAADLIGSATSNGSVDAGRLASALATSGDPDLVGAVLGRLSPLDAGRLQAGLAGLVGTASGALAPATSTAGLGRTVTTTVETPQQKQERQVREGQESLRQLQQEGQADIDRVLSPYTKLDRGAPATPAATSTRSPEDGAPA